MPHNAKLYIASILSVFIILLSWDSFYSLGCASLIFPIIILIIISYSFIDRKMNERECFKNCYFNDTSRFSKILLSPYLVSLFYFILSILLTLTLMYGIIDYPNLLWGYLIIHIIVVILIYKKTMKALKNTIGSKYIEIFAREVTIHISSILLFIVYIYIFINGYEPTYLRETIELTINSASTLISSNCTYIDYIVRVNQELDGAFWWLVINSSEANKSEDLKSIIWVSFILINTLSILGINRFIVQVVYLLNKLFKGKMKNEK